MIRCIEANKVEKKIVAKREKQKQRMADLRGSKIEKLVCTNKEGDMK